MALTERRRAAFTLIELLVAIGILAVLAGMSLTVLRRDTRGIDVRAAADQLAGTLRQARAMALRDGAEYGVAFNIQNAVGTQGTVLNNHGGGHYYRIIGPVTSFSAYNGASGRSGMVPWPMVSNGPNTIGSAQTGISKYLNTFDRYIEQVAAHWVSDPIRLPARKVRFLALADTDEGARVITGYDVTTAAGSTYPRPWFGYFDTGSSTLMPWGGYGASSASGFYYQGADGAVSGSTTSVARSFNRDTNNNGAFADTDLNGDGDTDDIQEREVAFPLLVAGAPRPLINADWLDVVVIFRGDGTVDFRPWMDGRRAYQNQQVAMANFEVPKDSGIFYSREQTASTQGHNGVQDMASSGSGEYQSPMAAHFTRHTGGYFITLAPDVAVADQTRFTSAAEAIASMTPMVRVFISTEGEVRVVPVQIREDALSRYGTTTYPVSGNWNNTSTATTSFSWVNARYGWFHAVTHGTETARDVLEKDLTPRGKTSTDAFNATMLTTRTWWVE